MPKKGETRSAEARRRQSRNIRRNWKPLFLAAFAACGNITHAAQEVGLDRGTIRMKRKKDPAFDAAFLDAQDVAVDKLEQEAWRRAHDGWDEPVFYQGDECGRVRKYDSTMLIFLLKANRPEKYRETIRHENFNFDPRDLSDEQLERIADGENPMVVIASQGARGSGAAPTANR